MKQDIQSRLELTTWFGRCLCAAAALTLGGAIAMLSGCETTEGFGKDVEKLGDNIENKAAEKK